MDERGEPIAGLVAAVSDVDLGPRDDPLGESVTDARGAYRIAYRPRAYGFPFTRKPDLLVRVFDRVGIRELARSVIARDVSTVTYEAPDVIVPRASIDGWAATLGSVEPSRLTRGNAVDVLADDAQFDAMASAIRGARRSVHLAQLLFKDAFATYPREGPARALVDDVVAAARAGATVRILLNENQVIADDVDELRAIVAAHEAPNVEVRAFPMSPNVMHAKILVVDDREAFVIGPPFQQKFWDTPGHAGEDMRRGNDRPTHDMTVRLRGPAVRHVAATFALLWNERSRLAHEERDLVEDLPAIAPTGRVSAQLVRTLPQRVFRDLPAGEQGILEAFGRALANAERLVYLENQYFTSATVTRSLARLLNARPDVEVILVANDEVDIPTYDRWQARGVRALAHERFGAFVLARATLADPRRHVAPVYVHSKAAVVDDRWALVGTANLDGISLESADEFGVDVPSNVDVSVALLDGVDGEPQTGIARDLRARLWSEHLQLAREDVARTAPEGGWLRVWREMAEANARAFEAGRPQDFRGRVLPYRPEAPITRGLTLAGPG